MSNIQQSELPKPKEKKIDKWKYSLNDQLGKGAYGTVYKGVSIETGEYVAVKVIDKKLVAKSPFMKIALQKEVDIMREFNSCVNIVNFHQMIETQNNFYLVQEYCSEGDLDQIMKRNKIKRFEEEEAKKILIDVLNGFQELVGLGIIHRDLKPDNILREKGNYKIADFGFSRHIEGQDELLKTVCGTPLYESPQILQKQQYSSKSDVWSLFFIYYQILYGNTPWTARSINELVYNIHNQPLKFDDNIPVSEHSKDIIRRGLQLKESDRMSWAQAFDHPLVKGRFKFTQEDEDNMRLRQTLDKISFRILLNKNNMQNFFKNLKDISRHKQLSLQEFKDKIQQIDDRIYDEDVEFIFSTIDVAKGGSISLSDFLNWLVQNGVDVSLEDMNSTTKMIENMKKNKEHAQKTVYQKKGEEVKDQEINTDGMNATVFNFKPKMQHEIKFPPQFAGYQFVPIQVGEPKAEGFFGLMQQKIGNAVKGNYKGICANPSCHKAKNYSINSTHFCFSCYECKYVTGTKKYELANTIHKGESKKKGLFGKLADNFKEAFTEKVSAECSFQSCGEENMVPDGFKAFHCGKCGNLTDFRPAHNRNQK